MFSARRGRDVDELERAAFKPAKPIVIGSIEASLRRDGDVLHISAIDPKNGSLNFV